MKLHLGCGSNLLEGWHNVDDWDFSKPGFMFTKWDLSGTLPINVWENSQNFIFTEHFLEHLPRNQAVDLLRACHKSLKVGGVIRIVVPCLAHLVKKYIAKDLDWGGPGGWEPKTPAQMMNEGTRLWGHQFMYDLDELALVLREAGFTWFEFPEWRESIYPELRNLEVRPKVSDIRIEAVKI